MSATRRNRSIRKVGRGRGVSIRLARAIGKKFSLSQLIIFTSDAQRRQRLVTWGKSTPDAIEATTFATCVARDAGWPKPNCEIELAFVRKLKSRIKELEAACAQIVDGCPDPVAVARAAGKFPDESDGDGPRGEWVFISNVNPRPKESPVQYNVLTPEQLTAESVKQLAYWTWRKLCALNFGNVAGEIETATYHALRTFGGWHGKKGR